MCICIHNLIKNNYNISIKTIFYKVASMTEKIVNLARHLAINKKDKRSLRGFDVTKQTSNHTII